MASDMRITDLCTFTGALCGNEVLLMVDVNDSCMAATGTDKQLPVRSLIDLLPAGPTGPSGPSTPQTIDREIAWYDSYGNASGTNSHADSYGCALGDYSHADSYGCATGYCSHADSYGITCGNATGSHADSYGCATGCLSHADSYGCATGCCSHADSRGTANGTGAHADSYGCATGCCSHADSRGIACGDCSHAAGPGAVARYACTYAYGSVAGAQIIEATQCRALGYSAACGTFCRLTGAGAVLQMPCGSAWAVEAVLVACADCTGTGAISAGAWYMRGAFCRTTSGAACGVAGAGAYAPYDCQKPATFVGTSCPCLATDSDGCVYSCVCSSCAQGYTGTCVNFTTSYRITERT